MLLMRKQKKKFPDSEPLVTLYEKTGNRMYYLSMVHMILGKIILHYRLTDLIPQPEN
jgi:hypothetical protein